MSRDMKAVEILSRIPVETEVDVHTGYIDLENTDLDFRVNSSISDLVDDIEKYGQQSTVILRRIEGSSLFQLVSGYRRLRAIKTLGRNTIRAVVLADLSDEDAFRLAFSENIKRRNLTGIDKANAILKLELRGSAPGEIQKIFGIGERQYQRLRKINTYPDALKTPMIANRITTGHGITLMQFYEQHSGKVNLDEWVKKIEDEELSVRQLQKALKEKFGKPNKHGGYIERYRDGGFKLHAMDCKPKSTKKRKMKKMAQVLREALTSVEQYLEEV